MSATKKKADMSRYVTKANLAGAFFENAAMLGEKPLLFLKSKGKWTGKNGTKLPIPSSDWLVPWLPLA